MRKRPRSERSTVCVAAEGGTSHTPLTQGAPNRYTRTSLGGGVPKTFGPYEVLDRLGEGGMGEVYRARDTRLDRTVAIKVLRASQDEELRARFEREARTISQLSHPHICVLYDLGSQDGLDYLVMEHLEGETLAARLERGALPASEALMTAIQIADALDEAHRRGVVHRDLKPSNVMLTAQGAKLLDFGLAKPLAGAGVGEISSGHTLVGTLPYMSPEQIQGEELDARSDLFSFGAVLYEMLTGERAFAGDNQASLTAAILTHEPPQSGETPSRLQHILARCLAKDPDERWQTARDLMLELEWATEIRAQEPVEQERKGAWIGWAAAAVAVSAAIMGWSFDGGEAREPLELSIRLPGDADPIQLSISPEGKRLLYVGDEARERRLYVRGLDSSDARVIPGATGVREFAWSPDGRSVVYSTNDRIMRTSLTRGEPVTVTRAVTAGIAWGVGGDVLYGAGWQRGLMRVGEDGGEAEQVTELDADEVSHRRPRFLPDGRHFIYVSVSPAGNRICLGELGSDEQSVLTEAEAGGFYVDSDDGRGLVLFVRDGTLFSQELDLAGRRLVGEPSAIKSGVTASVLSGQTSVSASARTLIVPDRSVSEQSRALAWIGPTGEVVRRHRGRRNYAAFDLVPALGSVVAKVSGDTQIWRVDLDTGDERLAANGVVPVVSRDGSRLFFARQGGEGAEVVAKAVDGSGRERVVFTERTRSWPNDVFGRDLIVNVASRENREDLLVVDSETGGGARPLFDSPAAEMHARFSPDGRWIAYSVNQGAGHEIFVSSYPPGETRWKISHTGGWAPSWRSDGAEIYFLDNEGRMMAAEVDLDSALQTVSSAEPRFLFQTQLDLAAGYFYRVTGDPAAPFLMTRRFGGEQTWTVLIDWQARRGAGEG